MRNAYEADLDRMEAAYRREGEHWALVHAFVILGGLGAAGVGVAARSSLATGLAGLEHPPDALLDRLALGGYREPPRVVRLTGGRRAPVRLGVLPAKPIEKEAMVPKVRVAIDASDASEADAEGRDVERDARLVGGDASARDEATRDRAT